MLSYRPVNVPATSSNRGTMPLKLDGLIFLLIKSCFGSLFLYMFLVIALPILREDPNYNILVEIAYIFPIMMVSDFVASHLANYLDVKLIKHWGYMRNIKSKKNRVHHIIQYIIYVVVRISFIMFGLFWLLFDTFKAQLLFPFNTTTFSFLLTVIITTISARFIAWILANIIYLK